MNNRKSIRSTAAIMAMSAVMESSSGVANSGIPVFEIKNNKGHGGSSKIRESAPSYTYRFYRGNYNTIKRDHNSPSQARRNAKKRRNLAK